MRSVWNNERPGFLLQPFLFILFILSLIYRCVCWVRKTLYRVGIFRTRRLDAMVISIGNLTVGGTGKTPFTIAVARYLADQGLKVGVLSRGYRGKRDQDIQWVSDGQRILANPGEVGEEAYLMASQLDGVPVMVGRNRFKAGQKLLQQFRQDVLILDDGFQHIGLQRDLNLLIIDGSMPFGRLPVQGFLLPRGMLREPIRELRRASAVLVSRMEQCDHYPEIIRTIKKWHPGMPVFKIFSSARRLVHLTNHSEKEVDYLAGKSVLAFSGIGNPDSFRTLLEQLGGKIVHEEVFKDHHHYSAQDVQDLLKQARRHTADMLVTTEKDAVKLREYFGADAPVWVLQIRMERVEDRQRWEPFIREQIKDLLLSN